MKNIYMLKETTRYFDRYNKEGMTEYERSRMDGEIIEEENIGYFETIEEAKGEMLAIERRITDTGSYEKEYFHSSPNDRIHEARYLELNVKGKPTKSGIEVRIVVITIPLGKMSHTS